MASQSVPVELLRRRTRRRRRRARRHPCRAGVAAGPRVLRAGEFRASRSARAAGASRGAAPSVAAADGDAGCSGSRVLVRTSPRVRPPRAGRRRVRPRVPRPRGLRWRRRPRRETPARRGPRRSGDPSPSRSLRRGRFGGPRARRPPGSVNSLRVADDLGRHLCPSGSAVPHMRVERLDRGEELASARRRREDHPPRSATARAVARDVRRRRPVRERRLGSRRRGRHPRPLRARRLPSLPTPRRTPRRRRQRARSPRRRRPRSRRGDDDCRDEEGVCFRCRRPSNPPFSPEHIGKTGRVRMTHRVRFLVGGRARLLDQLGSRVGERQPVDGGVPVVGASVEFQAVGPVGFGVAGGALDDDHGIRSETDHQ